MNTKTIHILLLAAAVIFFGYIVSTKLLMKDVAHEGEKTGAEETITINDTDWVQGDAASPLTMIEYADYQCPACAAYYPIVETIKKEFASSTRFVFRVFPLQGHMNGMSSALAAEAAGAQGAYWQMQEKLFTHQDEWGDSVKAKEIFTRYAGELGLDTVRFTEDMARKDLLEKVRDSYKGGASLGVDRTPTFFVNGVKITVPTGGTPEDVVAGFRDILQKAASSTQQ